MRVAGQGRFLTSPFAAGAALLILCVSRVIVDAQTFPRQDLRFSANWKFIQSYVNGAQATSFNDAAWTTVCLPHTVHVESAVSHGAWAYYQGYCCYRKSFVPDSTWRGKKVFLEFEAAMQTDTIWVNGNLKLVYLGGYNPFTIDITGDLQFGVTNVIAVCLNNSVNTNVSPGNTQPDFYYYGGLYRDVTIHVMDSLHITDPVYANKVGGGGVFVTDSAVSTASAIVQVKTNVINEFGSARNCVVKTSLIDSNGAVLQTNTLPAAAIAVGRDSTLAVSFTVTIPRLWSPNYPNLYRILTQVYDGSRPADSMTTTIGIKTISFTRADGFVLNGTRIIARGANRHQDYGGIGNAVPVSGQYRDALRLKEGGFNFVRLSHYLQNQAFMDACDKLGIMVEPSLVGWQYTAGYSNTTFSNNLQRDLRTMIRYYRNHPSVICWESVMNESSPPSSFAAAAQLIAHAEYPGNQMYTAGQDGSNTLDIYQAATQQGGRTYSTTKPGGISEYGHWDFGGFTSSSNQTRAALDAGMLTQVANHSSSLSTDRGYSWMSFDALWVYNDYFGFSQYANSLCSGGIVDVFRIPKYSWYFFQSQRDPAIIMPGISSGPMVFIANQWRNGSPTSVKVYSNCSQVSLYLNDSLVGTRSPDAGGATGNLEHPPFTFSISSWKQGTLRANGLINSAVVASDTIKTPVTAARVVVRLDTANMKLLADGSDLAIAYASIVDSNGTVMSAATNPVTFTVSGPGTIIAPDNNPVAAVGGIAAVYIQTQYNNAGRIIVTGTVTNLVTGSDTVTSALPQQNGSTGVVGRSPVRVASGEGFRMVRQGHRLSFVLPADALKSLRKALFMLYNVQGRLVKSWDLSSETGLTISTKGCRPGSYAGLLVAGGREHRIKLVTVE